MTLVHSKQARVWHELHSAGQGLLLLFWCFDVLLFWSTFIWYFFGVEFKRVDQAWLDGLWIVFLCNLVESQLAWGFVLKKTLWKNSYALLTSWNFAHKAHGDAVRYILRNQSKVCCLSGFRVGNRALFAPTLFEATRNNSSLNREETKHASSCNGERKWMGEGEMEENNNGWGEMSGWIDF